MIGRILSAYWLATLLALPSGVHATGSATPVELEPVAHLDATLTVVGPSGDVVYSIASLETLPTYRVMTTTPWRAESTVFEGVMLNDILSTNGLADVSAIRVTAENDYVSNLPADVMQSLPILVATRANGQPISRRERGPILFVIEDEIYGTSDLAKESYLVWMATRIEPGS